MSKHQATDVEATQRPRDVPKIRACLRCESEFPSQWSGERICPHCKNSAAWRNSSPYTAATRRRHR